LYECFTRGGYTALVAAGARSFDFDRISAFCTENPDDGICHQRARRPVPMTDADKRKTLASPEIAAERAHAGESHALPEVQAAFVMAPGPIQMLDPASLAAMRKPISIMLGDNDIDVPPATNGLIAAKAIPGATLLRLPGVGLVCRNSALRIKPAFRSSEPFCPVLARSCRTGISASTVATRGKPDMTRTAQFGRD
jgi:predicted dienelactone hydrolase